MIYDDDEVEKLADEHFPFRLDKGRIKLGEELFGERAFIIVPDDEDITTVYADRYTFNPDARWAYWKGPRFRTAADAVLFKLHL